MPVYNEEAHLDRALASIQAQSLQEWELVVVDDGSQDGTSDLLRAAAASDDRIRPVYCQHRGIVDALNQGIAQARTPLIARMDADDSAHPDRLSLQVAYLEQHPEVGVLATRVAYGGDPARNAGLARFVEWTNQILTPDSFSSQRFVESPLIHPSVVFRKTWVDQFGGYREGLFPEDYEMWLRFMENGVTFAKLPQTLLIWGERPNRLTRVDPRCSVDAFYRLKSSFLARWLESHNPFHPDVVVWGAGRATRKRLQYLLGHGVKVRAFIDVDPQKIGKSYHDAPVISHHNLPSPQESFVLTYVGNQGARSEIIHWLGSHGFRIGLHYMSVA